MLTSCESKFKEVLRRVILDAQQAHEEEVGEGGDDEGEEEEEGGAPQGEGEEQEIVLWD